MAAEIAGKERSPEHSGKVSADVQPEMHGVAVIEVGIVALQGCARPVIAIACITDIGFKLLVMEIAQGLQSDVVVRVALECLYRVLIRVHACTVQKNSIAMLELSCTM